ncbi:N-acetylmuramoyl-L-alanine amidase [Gordonia sp. VNK21]|uniref:N-acetylmuramoyl-L-alanine amidase n=1 Tax=Gordonia sp. VNK21 TaxID=3382483 RepID=UPI0038D3D286
MIRGIGIIAACGLIGAATVGCSDPESGSRANSATETVYVTPSAPESSTVDSSTGATTGRGCPAPVVALDPGHNAVETNEFDPVTGVLMRDYPNGAEDRDAVDVATAVKTDLEASGYKVVIVKPTAASDVTYRERVTRAEKAGADIGVSIHTYTNDHRIFVQRVGLYRSGTGADGAPHTVTFEDAAVAKKSQKYAAAIASARTGAEGREVSVTDNSFDGRAPLWGGNIPVISLISDKVPWVYSEFGTAAGGGSTPIGAAGVETYAQGLAAGIKDAVPNTCR